MSVENRRIEVHRLLREATDAKLLRHATEDALRKAGEAYQLATKSPELTQPWPQLCAYRCAQLLLRGNPKTREELEKIDQLFAEAARMRSLCALPRLYRLAVLQRLRRLAPDEFSSFVKARFEDAHRAVQAEISRMSRATAKMQIQDGLVNLLELSAYFLEVPYEPLEGFRDTGFFEGRDWHLVGPTPEISQIRYSESLCLEELDSRAERNPEALIFCLPEDREAWCRDRFHANRGLRESTARLLSVLLGEPRSRTQLAERALGDEASAAAIRKARQRFKEDLARITGRLTRDFEGPAPDLLSIPPDLVIIGAVAEIRLSQPMK